MAITVKILSEANEALTLRRDELLEEKKDAEHKREELKISVKKTEDTAAKILQNKLNRDKTAEAKELLAKEELLIISNEDLNNKL